MYIDSIIHKLDARIKIINLFILISSIIISSSIKSYFFISLIILALVFISKIPFKNIFYSIKKLWMFFIVIILMNSLFYENGEFLVSFWIFRISKLGLWQGVKVILNIVIIMILSNILTGSTSPVKITDAIGSLLKPLKIFQIPIEDIAMIISIAIQFIPTLIDEVEVIKKAQISRGARFESKHITERAKSFLPLVIPIFISAFRRADELSIAMEARGYKNAKNRTPKNKKSLQKIDIIAILFCAIVFLIQYSCL